MAEEKIMRMTDQRRTILQCLREVNSHPAADQVYDMVRKTLPRISLATVYRNLESMAGSGVILKLETFGTKKRFDGATNKHYHIYCVECGRLDDVSMELLDNIESDLQSVVDYEVTGHSIEFEGICPDCRE